MDVALDQRHNHRLALLRRAAAVTLPLAANVRFVHLDHPRNLSASGPALIA